MLGSNYNVFLLSNPYLTVQKDFANKTLNLNNHSYYILKQLSTKNKFTKTGLFVLLSCVERRIKYKKLNTILEKVGIKDLGIGYHIFRHNAASKLEQNGVEASTIKDILGNSTNVVLSTYLNQGIKRKQEVINLNSERIKKYVKSCENIKFRRFLG